ncbi:hypothetical protein K2173_007294 [Erythroxylum novogranatense]|uniref:Protein kinase domain-containing protein n=1 Tax=Erythroxylum novogranatense TaxID=1862640 RepID=A0AAV8T7J0_9ROSI|nr:hypothetical protein K2173_007294 [Erythroxylum novogranatense]
MFPPRIGDNIRQRADQAVADKVLVAVKAEKVISNTALAWALTHIVHPGDCITLLAVFSEERSGKRFWGFPRLAGDCTMGQRERLPDPVCEISESCSRMVLQFHNQIEVGVRVKVVSGTTGSAVAVEAKRNRANWVVVDKKLKQELKHCLEELHCNIMVMKGSQPKILRLNLGCSDEVQTPYYSAAPSPEKDINMIKEHRMKHSTPVSSPEEPGYSSSRSFGSSLSSSDSPLPLILVYDQNPLFEGANKGKYSLGKDGSDSEYEGPRTTLDSERASLISSATNAVMSSANNQKSVFWIAQNHIVDKKTPLSKKHRNNDEARFTTSRTLLDKFMQYDQDSKAGLDPNESSDKIGTVSSGIRTTVSISRTNSTPPPLCTICQHKAPAFGKPPREFTYEELKDATDGFSDAKFLAKGGFGNVYKGMLRDGQVVAVKLLKSGGSQADAEFCREVRVLSCAQHRNVVLLIGFCIAGKKRILVYEYICNGSLDFHLHGIKRGCLDWPSRMRIAVGAARGLRYLHEDCRVGCLVHRDMRPNNILVTHDFEPLVADFGLVRWKSEWNISTEYRVIGTSEYLAPEYVDGGIITEKFDVYAFGVVLLELMTGRRINELQLYKEQHFLSERFHTLARLEPSHALSDLYQLLDPCLLSKPLQEYAYQIQAMSQATVLCLCRDPESRPPMSKVLRILEGGNLVPLGLDLNSVGNRSGHLRGLSSQKQSQPRRSHSRNLSH